MVMGGGGSALIQFGLCPIIASSNFPPNLKIQLDHNLFSYFLTHTQWTKFFEARTTTTDSNEKVFNVEKIHNRIEVKIKEALSWSRIS